MKRNIAVFSALVCLNCGWIAPARSQTLPPPEDTPEEILRTEIYTEARSPVDGSALSAAEYIELREDLMRDTSAPEAYVSRDLQRLIGALKLRKFLRTVIPFMP